MNYSYLPLVQRALREIVAEDIDSIKVDSKETYANLHEFSKEFIPELSEKIEHYTGECPIFDMHSVEDEIQKSLKRKVQLKSGGYLIIDQTEAMTTIDVNTGGFVGVPILVRDSRQKHKGMTVLSYYFNAFALQWLKQGIIFLNTNLQEYNGLYLHL